ncbi:hypothetical protein [Chungangia koreensis]
MSGMKAFFFLHSLMLTQRRLMLIQSSLMLTQRRLMLTQLSLMLKKEI